MSSKKPKFPPKKVPKMGPNRLIGYFYFFLGMKLGYEQLILYLLDVVQFPIFQETLDI